MLLHPRISEAAAVAVQFKRLRFTDVVAPEAMGGAPFFDLDPEVVGVRNVKSTFDQSSVVHEAVEIEFKQAYS